MNFQHWLYIKRVVFCCFVCSVYKQINARYNLCLITVIPFGVFPVKHVYCLLGTPPFLTQEMMPQLLKALSKFVFVDLLYNECCKRHHIKIYQTFLHLCKLQFVPCICIVEIKQTCSYRVNRQRIRCVEYSIYSPVYSAFLWGFYSHFTISLIAI